MSGSIAARLFERSTNLRNNVQGSLRARWSGAASFGPSFLNDGKRIVFSSNYDPVTHSTGGMGNFELWLINSNIPEYLQANRFNHTPKRPRKLLLHKRQISKLIGAVEREGMTLVPLKLYFNEKGRAKVELALARGKKLYDKRETEKKRSWARERGRLLRQKG